MSGVKDLEPGARVRPEALRFGADGLIPAIVVDEEGQVLMLAYMDAEALSRTLRDGRTWYYSRSRRTYWAKGETSGAIQEVLAIRADCDGDALLVQVRQHAPGACHTGAWSCFMHPLVEGEA